MANFVTRSSRIRIRPGALAAFQRYLDAKHVTLFRAPRRCSAAMTENDVLRMHFQKRPAP